MDQHDLILLAVAGVNAVTAFLYWDTRRLVKVAQADIATVEKATNSMKDALVKATGEKSLLEGQNQGRAEGKEEIAVLTDRLKSGQPEPAKSKPSTLNVDVLNAAELKVDKTK